jgi:uncharacterized repeat protein (TIGR04052 family)
MTSARRLASRLLLGIGLFCCVACPANRAPVNIEFSATWAGQPLRCGESGLSLTDLRFFVSDVVLINSQGAENSLLLTDGVALIDLENGEGACSNGTQETKTTLSGSSETADIEGIRFTVGVPFELNHANPLLAKAPLDDSAMHWHWRSGYKFLRAGVTTESDGFWVHLGSTGCKGTIQNISGCQSPNRVTVELSGFSPENKQIDVDLAALFEGVDLDDGIRSDCSSGPSESACTRPFANLGLAFGGIQESTISGSVFQVGH